MVPGPRTADRDASFGASSWLERSGVRERKCLKRVSILSATGRPPWDRTAVRIVFGRSGVSDRGIARRGKRRADILPKSPYRWELGALTLSQDLAQHAMEPASGTDRWTRYARAILVIGFSSRSPVRAQLPARLAAVRRSAFVLQSSCSWLSCGSAGHAPSAASAICAAIAA